MATTDTQRQLTSHWHVQILIFNTELHVWLCYYPEYLSSTKNITVYAMINIYKLYVFRCCVSNKLTNAQRGFKYKEFACYFLDATREVKRFDFFVSVILSVGLPVTKNCFLRLGNLELFQQI
jgi:hypothetical protein